MKNIAKVVFGLPIESSFDYLIPQKLINKIKIGCRVWVPFTNKRLVGYVVGFANESRFKKIKSVISLIDNEPILEKRNLEFLKDFSEYYCCSLGEAIETSIPPALKKGKEVILQKVLAGKKDKNASSKILIHDISQDKRWKIFSERIKDCLELNGAVIFLVPEATDILPTLKRLKEHFPEEEISVFNRKQKDSVQISEWQKVKNGLSSIVVGTRSAIFAPFSNLKLIIIDDEDSPSFKQEQTPFYHARDVAFALSLNTNAGLILASQTPSAESFYLAKKNKIKLVFLPEDKYSSLMQVVDMTRFSYEHKKRNAIVSYPLEDNMRRTLSEGGKIILFINRTGFSNIIRCRQCNFTLKCIRCNVSLTYHFDKKKLICRFCNYKIDPPELCPQCRRAYMRYSGMGTEKLESEISRIFPDKKILRLDRETGLKNEKFDILIATQIILKTYSEICADLVGVVAIDSALNRLDFRAAEKTFSLLIKLSMLAKQKTIVQTHHFNHYSIFSAAQRDFSRFYKEELNLRRGLGFPPFGHFISVMLRSKNSEAVKDLCLSLFGKLKQINTKNKIEIFEPLPDIPDKLRGFFRWHILLKGKEVKRMNKLIKNGLRKSGRKSGIIVSINVDI